MDTEINAKSSEKQMKKENPQKNKRSLKGLFSRRGKKSGSKKAHGFTLDMGFQWRVTLLLMVVASIFALTFALLLFQRMGGQIIIGLSGTEDSKVEDINRVALQNITSFYEEREREYQRLAESPILIPSPSSLETFSPKEEAESADADESESGADSGADSSEESSEEVATSSPSSQ